MNENKKTILVFTGLPGSGKDTVIDYLKEKHGAIIFSFTTMLHETLNRFHLEFNRDNLIKLSEMIRQTFGEDIMAKTMKLDVEKDSSNFIAIGNARRMADIKYLSQLSGFVLIEISADIEKRFERVSKRHEKTSDTNQTFDDFKATHQRSTELSIIELSKQATKQIDNNGTLEKLYEQLDKIVEKI